MIKLLNLRTSLMLRPTVCLPVCLGIKHPYGAYDQIFITVRQLWVRWCGAPSLTRGWFCRLQLLLAHARAAILGSESRGSRDKILLSQIRDSPFRRLLWLVVSRWRYSTPPPRGCFPPFDTYKSFSFLNTQSQSQSYVTTDGQSASLS
jgi:hypothetical protein